MPSKSPSMAFEPTPAIASNKENFSPLTENPNTSTHDRRSERRSSKEVHFSPVMSPARRAQSLATSVPFLEPISSASQLPRQSLRIKNTAPEVDMNAYMEQSRSLLEGQRLNFEREREIFENERKLWNAERAMLKARIADLEFSLNKNDSGRRRFSNDGSSASAQLFRKDFSQLSSKSISRASRGSSETNGGTPVWETPDMGATVTRVFSDEEQQPQSKKPVSITASLPSIAEGAIEKPLSPRSTPVPVTVLDSSLDGITLKSAGLESSFVKVSSPSSTSPPQPPSPGPRIPKEEKSLRVNLDRLLSPTDVNLVRNAGHTPMEFGKATLSAETLSAVESRKSSETDVPTPKHELDSTSRLTRPPMPPSERSDSYFSTAFEFRDSGEGHARQDGDSNGDVELKGPLMMDSKHEEGQDNQFLNQLDAMLRAESQRPRKESTVENGQQDGGVVKIDDDIDDGGLRLKLKKSMNFGSVFGSKNCGNI
jgi:hypothetical protein